MSKQTQSKQVKSQTSKSKKPFLLSMLLLEMKGEIDKIAQNVNKISPKHDERGASDVAVLLILTVIFTIYGYLMLTR